MSQANYVVPIVLGIVDAGDISAVTWVEFDNTPLDGACFMLRITNDSGSDIDISYDGIDSHEFIKAGNRIEVYFQTNSSPSGYVSKIKKGTKIYVQGATDQGGTIYLAGYYNSTN